MDARRAWMGSDLDVIMVGTWMLCGHGWGPIWTGGRAGSTPSTEGEARRSPNKETEKNMRKNTEKISKKTQPLGALGLGFRVP